jgi:hypothetical protein
MREEFVGLYPRTARLLVSQKGPVNLTNFVPKYFRGYTVTVAQQFYLLSPSICEGYLYNFEWGHAQIIANNVLKY